MGATAADMLDSIREAWRYRRDSVAITHSFAGHQRECLYAQLMHQVGFLSFAIAHAASCLAPRKNRIVFWA